MSDNSDPLGEVITFYSYKGGVGRSMALANIARCLSRPPSGLGKRVLVIDWDLDAPGLHRYFPRVQAAHERERAGLIDYFLSLRERLERDGVFAEAIRGDDGLRALGASMPLDDFVIANAAPGVDLMLAGRLNASYLDRVLGFHWTDFHEKYSAAIRLFRELIMKDYDYCLLDSRTGYTDISGICTALMPQKLVALFVPNEQNLEGVLQMVELAVEYRRHSDDSRPLTVFPVASRIDNAELMEKQSWLLRFQNAFEGLFRRLYLEECDLRAHFDKVQLPNVSYYAYGEKIAMLDEDRSRAGSLRLAYETFAERLALPYPWAVHS